MYDIEEGAKVDRKGQGLLMGSGKLERGMSIAVVNLGMLPPIAPMTMIERHKLYFHVCTRSIVRYLCAHESIVDVEVALRVVSCKPN